MNSWERGDHGQFLPEMDRKAFTRAFAGALLAPLLMGAAAEKPQTYAELEASWAEALREPIWYRKIVPSYYGLIAQGRIKDAQALELFVEQKLISHEINLGKTGKKWDAERQPIDKIDKIVIHQTGAVPGMRLSYLSALELIRIYGKYYFQPGKGDEEIEGQPVYSGHFRGGEQVFYPYHYLIRADGTVEQLLEDGEIGWHAGKWSVNCGSIGICLDGSFEISRPTDAQIEAIAKLVRDKYSYFVKYSDIGKHIIGHNEVVPGHTDCPGKLFLSTPERRGWKEEELKLITGKTSNSNVIHIARNINEIRHVPSCSCSMKRAA